MPAGQGGQNPAEAQGGQAGPTQGAEEQPQAPAEPSGRGGEGFRGQDEDPVEPHQAATPDAGGDLPSAPTVAPMRPVTLTGVVLELPSTHPAIVLREVDEPGRELHVTIGQPEGVAIAYAWRGIATPRPLTHDLLTSILEEFGVQVDVVRITRVEGPVFYAEMDLSGPTGTRTVECRPSDALALALRQRLPVPIVVAEEVLSSSGHPPGS